MIRERERERERRESPQHLPSTCEVTVFSPGTGRCPHNVLSYSRSISTSPHNVLFIWHHSSTMERNRIHTSRPFCNSHIYKSLNQKAKIPPSLLLLPLALAISTSMWALSCASFWIHPINWVSMILHFNGIGPTPISFHVFFKYSNHIFIWVFEGLPLNHFHCHNELVLDPSQTRASPIRVGPQALRATGMMIHSPTQFIFLQIGKY